MIILISSFIQIRSNCCRYCISFLPKVVSQFYMFQLLVLPSFFPSPSTTQERIFHTLDVRRALAFYLVCTQLFGHSARIFVSSQPPRRVLQVTSQRISKWVASIIHQAYQLAQRLAPQVIRPHSTRAVAASTVFLCGVPLLDVCASATWSQPSTFIKHYRSDVRQKSDATFGCAVLASTLA